MRKILVCGGGGFIGGHLIADLRKQGGCLVRAVDRKPVNDWFQVFPDVENLQLNLQMQDDCMLAAKGCDIIYNLAADMGGMGFIEYNKALCMLSVLINTHLLTAARKHGVQRFFFASSACVYNAEKQTGKTNVALVESDAYPALPEDGYGWEKLFSERMCRHFREDFGINTRVARYHNAFGPYGSFNDGREKAPAAICRKVIQAKLSGLLEIEIWGDGNQRRSFMNIDDCIKGTQLILNSDFVDPVNLGSSEMISINHLVDLVEEIAEVQLKRYYNLNAPRGVSSRSSDNGLIRQLFDWEPSTCLREGMEKTYRWIYDTMTR